MRQAGIYPKTTLHDRQFVADVQRAEGSLDGAGKTCLSILFGSYFVFLVKPEETSEFDQAAGELVFDLGGVFIAVVQA